MVIEDVAKHMPADGSVTITNNTKYHNFFNGGEQDRIHLVACVLENPFEKSNQTKKYMTEFSRGIFKVIASTSAGRALVYTIGHVCIAMTVVSVLTGASLWEAGLVALVEPTINGFWYYLLDKLWTKYIN